MQLKSRDDYDGPRFYTNEATPTLERYEDCCTESMSSAKTDVLEAIALDKKNGNILWQNAIKKEMDAVSIAFRRLRRCHHHQSKMMMYPRVEISAKT